MMSVPMVRSSNSNVASGFIAGYWKFLTGAFTMGYRQDL